jgi:adenosylcobinamide kinase / adenosylcobinamide-phosphate guanylyltransferase
LPAHQPVLIDCLTIWLTNHMLAEHDLDTECQRLADLLSRPRGPWFVVSNEVGQGIVPDNALARRFRDAAGRLNQQIAAVADKVLLMVAGLPLKVK